MTLLDLYKRRKRKEEQLREQGELEDMIERQHELGQIIYKTLSNAGQKNTSVNVGRDGTIYKNVGNIKVEKFKRKDGNVSIIVSAPDPTYYTTGESRKKAYPILQVDVQRDNLHVFFCPYGPDRNYSLSSLETAKKDLSKYVEKFSLFP